MNKTEKYLLDAAIDLAVKKDFDDFIVTNEPQTQLPPQFDKRIRRTIRRKSFMQFCLDNFRVITAACLCIMVAGIGIGIPLYVEANEPSFYMLTDQDIYRGNMSVQFLCEEADSVSAKELIPRSAADVLDEFELIRTYSAEAVYIEEYDGVRYEQTSLYAEGQYIIPTKDKNIRNIVIGDYIAVLVFDEGHAAIVWRDDDYSYMLEGDISADDAMRYARSICE